MSINPNNVAIIEPIFNLFYKQTEKYDPDHSLGVFLDCAFKAKAYFKQYYPNINMSYAASVMVDLYNRKLPIRMDWARSANIYHLIMTYDSIDQFQ